MFKRIVFICILVVGIDLYLTRNELAHKRAESTKTNGPMSALNNQRRLVPPKKIEGDHLVPLEIFEPHISDGTPHSVIGNATAIQADSELRAASDSSTLPTQTSQEAPFGANNSATRAQESSQNLPPSHVSELLNSRSENEGTVPQPRVVWPLVLMEVDPAIAPLPPAQQSIIASNQKEFIQRIGGEDQPADSPGYVERWIPAQRAANERLRAHIGWQAYREYERAAIITELREKRQQESLPDDSATDF